MGWYWCSCITSGRLISCHRSLGLDLEHAPSEVGSVLAASVSHCSVEGRLGRGDPEGTSGGSDTHLVFEGQTALQLHLEAETCRHKHLDQNQEG